MLSVGLANQQVTCSDIEVRTLQPPGGQTCIAYLQDFISSSGGYLLNEQATSDCQFCPISSTNTFLTAVSASYDRRWRNFGILWAFIVFNICAAVGCKFALARPAASDSTRTPSASCARTPTPAERCLPCLSSFFFSVLARKGSKEVKADEEGRVSGHQGPDDTETLPVFVLGYTRTSNPPKHKTTIQAFLLPKESHSLVHPTFSGFFFSKTTKLSFEVWQLRLQSFLSLAFLFNKPIRRVVSF